MSNRSIHLGGREYPVRLWQGEHLSGASLALDTETEAFEAGFTHVTPNLVLCQACNGRDVVILQPPYQNLAAFLEMHLGCDWVFHNSAFDLRVLLQHLGAEHPLRSRILRHVRDGRVQDCMLLDRLLRLARIPDVLRGKNKSRKLEALAQIYLGLSEGEFQKDERYRLFFGSLMGQPVDLGIDWGFIDYAARDAVVTYRLYHEHLAPTAWRVMRLLLGSEAGRLARSYGLLTETIQVCGALALAECSEVGVRLDTEAYAAFGREARGRHGKALAALEVLVPGVIKRGEDGGIKYTKKNKPQVRQQVLRVALAKAAASILEGRPELPPTARTEKSNELSAKVDDWLVYRGHHPVVDAFLVVGESLQDVAFADYRAIEGRLHTRFNPLMVTGRTSSSGPNLQNLPRDGQVRGFLIPDPGMRFLIADYKYIELVCLAAACERLFGVSHLADGLRAGKDPHALTAAAIKNIPEEEFCARLAQKDKEAKELRSKAKAVNFGFPGGMGVTSFTHYAAKTYGQQFTLDEAQAFREIFLSRYPEVRQFLCDNPGDQLLRSLGVGEDVVLAALEMEPEAAEAFVTGLYWKARKGLLHEKVASPRGWLAADDALAQLEGLRCRLFKWLSEAPNERTTLEAANFFGYHAVTLTGRVRRGTTYTAFRNTQFQGLAADGAKLACFDLMADGYTLVGFIHDEVIIQLPAASDMEAERQKVEAIMAKAMQSVLGADLPVLVDSRVADSWAKE